MQTPSFQAELAAVQLPRYERLPSIGLYKDQVLELLNGYISPFYMVEKPVTDTMVNNYVKLKVIAPPVKKRYNRFQLAQLIMTCLLKKVLSIAEIRQLLGGQEEEKLSQLYDCFCTELERAVALLLDPSQQAPYAAFLREMDRQDAQHRLLSSAIGSFVCKVCFEVLLAEKG